MRSMMLRRCSPLFAWVPIAGCAVGAGGTVGLHYTTDQGVRVQVEVPLEIDLVGSGTTAAEQGKPYLRAAAVPQIYYGTRSGKVDGGVRAALGPVFASRGTWLGPAFTVGFSDFRGKGALDVGFAADLDVPFSNDASCDDLRFTNLITPQLSLTRRVYDVNHPWSAGGGAWDVGIAAGLRRTVFLSCGGASSVARATP